MPEDRLPLGDTEVLLEVAGQVLLEEVAGVAGAGDPEMKVTIQLLVSLAEMVLLAEEVVEEHPYIQPEDPGGPEEPMEAEEAEEEVVQAKVIRQPVLEAEAAETEEHMAEAEAAEWEAFIIRRQFNTELVARAALMAEEAVDVGVCTVINRAQMAVRAEHMAEEAVEAEPAWLAAYPRQRLLDLVERGDSMWLAVQEELFPQAETMLGRGLGVEEAEDVVFLELREDRLAQEALMSAGDLVVLEALEILLMVVLDLRVLAPLVPILVREMALALTVEAEAEAEAEEREEMAVWERLHLAMIGVEAEVEAAGISWRLL